MQRAAKDLRAGRGGGGGGSAVGVAPTPRAYESPMGRERLARAGNRSLRHSMGAGAAVAGLLAVGVATGRTCNHPHNISLADPGFGTQQGTTQGRHLYLTRCTERPLAGTAKQQQRRCCGDVACAITLWRSSRWKASGTASPPCAAWMVRSRVSSTTSAGPSTSARTSSCMQQETETSKGTNARGSGVSLCRSCMRTGSPEEATRHGRLAAEASACSSRAWPAPWAHAAGLVEAAAAA